jgi:phospholipase/carboxylesterase
MRGSLIEREDAVVLEPAAHPTGLVVWLHGLGADGYDFVPFARALALAERGLRVVLPHAPQRPVTINGGYVMRAWYDVRDPNFERAPDLTGIAQSAGRVSALLTEQRDTGVPVERMVVAGFSQGGVIALEVGLHHPPPVTGIIALSAYLARPESLQARTAAAGPGPALFIGHGDQDPLVPLRLGSDSAGRLTALGYDVQFRRYRMAHSVCDAEASDVEGWLRRVLP